MFGASLLKLIKMKIAFSLATASVLIVGMVNRVHRFGVCDPLPDGLYPQT